MKKIYSLLLAGILSLIGMDANAFTLFVEVDDISRISEITTYPAQSSTVDLSGEIALQYDDNASIRYVSVTAVDGMYITHYKFVDEDGRELVSKANASGKLSYISVPSQADYGKLIITTATKLVPDGKIKVNLKGNPAKVSMSLNARRTVTLEKGEQIIEYISATEGGTLYIMPVGVMTLYRVVVNGEEVKPILGWDDKYQYNVRLTLDDEIDIETDYPDKNFTFKLSVPEGLEAMVEKVTVNGTAISNWKEASIAIGSRLIVTMNDGDYRLTKFAINGGENMVGATDQWGTPMFINSWATLVDSDIEIVAEGYYIERPYSFKVHLYNFANVENDANKGVGGFSTLAGATSASGTYYFARSNNKPLELEDGGEIKFCDEDNPFMLIMTAYTEDENEDVEITVQVNDKTVEGNWNHWEITLQDGDDLSIYFGVEPNGVKIDNTKEQPLSKATYDMQGRSIKKPAHGLYITNNRKVLLR